MRPTLHNIQPAHLQEGPQEAAKDPLSTKTRREGKCILGYIRYRVHKKLCVRSHKPLSQKNEKPL